MTTLVDQELEYSAGIAFHVRRSLAKRLNRRVGLEEHPRIVGIGLGVQ